MNRFERILNRVEVAREYDVYISEEGEEPYPGEDEKGQFNDVLDSIEREVKMLREEHNDAD